MDMCSLETSAVFLLVMYMPLLTALCGTLLRLLPVREGIFIA